jgi:hypothetical protein
VDVWVRSDSLSQMITTTQRSLARQPPVPAAIVPSKMYMHLNSSRTIGQQRTM